MSTSKKKAAADVFLPVLDGVPMARITKPMAAQNAIYRTHLIEKILQPVPHATLIVAPSGFGKTILASQAADAAEASDEYVVFYTVEELDTVLDTCRNVTSALRLQVPNFAPWAEEFFEGDFHGVDWVVRVCNDISSSSKTFFFIWDGAQNYSEAHFGMLQSFINLMPDNVRILTLRNIPPRASYAKIASQGNFTYLTANDLRFSSEDISHVANQHGLNYLDKEVASAFEKVQGWPLGIKILASSLANRDEVMKISSFESNTLISHAVDLLDCDDRDFLEKISLLDAVSADEAFQITKFPDTEMRLKRLRESGTFISQVSINPSRFAINPLVRNLLMERVYSDTKKLVHIGYPTIEIAIKSGKPLKAIALLNTLGEEKRAEALAWQNVYQMMMSGDAEFLSMWVERKKVDDKDDIFLIALLKVYIKLISFDIDGGRALLNELENDLSLSAEVDKFEDEIGLVRARCEFWVGNFTECIRLATQRKDLKLIRRDGLPGAVARGMLPALESAFILQDRLHFQEMFDHVIAITEDSNPHHQKLVLPQMRAMEAFLDGRYREALDHSNLALSSYESLNVKGIYIPYSAAYIAADVLLEFAEDSKSVQTAEKYLQIAIKAQQWPWVVAFYSKMALAKMYQGETTSALSLIQESRDWTSSSQFNSQINIFADLIEIIARAQLGDVGRIIELLDRGFDTPTISTLRTVFEARRNSKDSLVLLGRLPESTPHQKFIKSISLLEALVTDRKAALPLLETALNLGSENGYFRSFLNLSPEAKSLILDYSNEHPTMYNEKLARSIRNLMKNVQAVDDKSSLTKRELDILRRLATGLPITQIATSLDISNNTIKTHLKNVYRKMNVESREEAVIRGRELALL